MIPDRDVIRCLLIPFAMGELLLPSSAVAEIVRMAPLEPAGPGTPGWLIGVLDWRGLRVPVVRLSEAEVPNGRETRIHIVVCFMPGADRRLPYVGIECAGLPQLQRVTAKTLEPEIGERGAAPPFTMVAFRHEGKPAWMLDLESLEHNLLD